ncbi:hypothetical protein BH10PLA1_BH10PLA1_06290 [soil metagenome]
MRESKVRKAGVSHGLSRRLASSRWLALAVAAVGSWAGRDACAAIRTWNNNGTDFNTGTNWTGGLPGTGDVAQFGTAAQTNAPNVSSNITINNLSFVDTSGYTLSGSNPNTAKLTLTSIGTTPGTNAAISISSSVALATVNVNISAALVLGQGSGNTAIFATTGAANSTLSISGDISELSAGTNVKFTPSQSSNTLSLSGNNTYSGTTQVTFGGLNINSATAIGSGNLLLTNTITLDNTSAGAVVLANNNNLIFSAGTQTFVGTHDLSFGSGTLTLNGTMNFIVSASTLTIGSLDADTTARTFQKSGAGTLVISNAAGANFQGTTTISAGTLVVGNSTTLGTGTINCTSGTLAASTDLSGANAIANLYTFLTASSIAGSNNIELKNLAVGSSRTLVNNISNVGGAKLTLSSGNMGIGTGANTQATFTINGTGDTLISGNLTHFAGTSPSNLLYSGSGTLTLSGAGNNYNGTTTVSSGTLAVSGSGKLGTTTTALAISEGTLDLGGTSQTVGAVTITGNGTIQNGTLSGTSYAISNSSGTSTISGNLAPNASVLTKSGAGLLSLSGTNQYTGGTTISGGTLSVGSAGAIGTTGTISFTGCSTLQFTSSNTTDYSNRFSSAAGQTYGIDTNGQNITLGTALTSSNGTLTKVGTGNLTLGAANTYGGTTTVAEGVLKFGVNDAIKVANALTIGGGSNVVDSTLDLNGFSANLGTMNIGGGAAGTTSNILVGSGNLSLSGSGIINYNGSTNNANGATISSTGGFVNLNINITKTFNVSDSTAAAADLTISAVITNGAGFSGGLTKTGNGTMVLTAANTFAGTVVVGSSTSVGGTLQFSGAGSIPVLQFTVNNGVFDLNGTTQGATASGTAVTMGGGPTGTSATIAIGSGTLNLVGSGGGITFSASNDDLGALISGIGGGVVVFAGNPTFTIGDSANAVNDLTVTANITQTTGNHKLTKSGAGTLALTGNNSFSGGVSIGAGNIAVGHDSALGNGTYTMTDTSGIRSFDTADHTIANVLGTFAGSSAVYTFGDATGVANGNLAFADTTSASLSATSAARTFAVYNTTTFAGGFSGGTSSLTKTGNGTMNITGTSTYTGNTTISAGRLLVNNSFASANVSVAAGATLGGNGTLTGSVITGGNTSVISPGSSPGNLTVGSLDASAGARIQFELGNSDAAGVSDHLVVSGALTGTTGVNDGGLVLDISAWGFGASGPQTGVAYTLITFGSSTNLTDGDFSVGSLGSGLVLDTAFGSQDVGGSSNLFKLNSNSLQIEFSSVPEPTSLSFLGMGAGALLARRRRAKKVAAV